MWANNFQNKNYNILLVDDRLGNLTSAGYLQYKLNKVIEDKYEKFKLKYGEFGVNITINPENKLKKLEFRLKSEPFDLILLDLNFQNEINCAEHTRCTEPRNDQKSCFYCKEISGFLPDEKPKYFYNELGAYWLRYKIRPFNPGIPVIIFTSKFKNDIDMASKYGIYEFNAAYFEKSRLLNPDGNGENKKDGFFQLSEKILEGIRRYEQAFKDKIEISDNRVEAELSAKNRDYMQTRLWRVHTECINTELKAKSPFQKAFSDQSYSNSNKYAVVFIDFDDMKSVNEKFGISKTNVVIKNFTQSLSRYVDENWKSILPEDYEWLPFYKPIVGRYFRERGDEFLIIFPKIIDKTYTDDGNKIGIQEFMENLRLEINSEGWQKRLFTFEGVSEYSASNKLTSSMGLFVFPDDLTIRSINKLRKLKDLRDPASNDFDKQNVFSKEVTELYSEITKISQNLKDQAKLLGKNQVCYFQKTRQLINNSDLYVNPRINVGIVVPDDDIWNNGEGMIEFLKNLTDNMVFDFEILFEKEIEKLKKINKNTEEGKPTLSEEINKLFNDKSKLEKEINKSNNYCINYHLLLYVYNGSIPSKKCKDLILSVDRIANKKCGLIILYKDDNVKKIEISPESEATLKDISSYRKFFVKDKWILSGTNKEKHSEIISNLAFLRDARTVFFNLISSLADAHKNDEYYPRFKIQESIYNKFSDLKKDVVILESEPPEGTFVGDMKSLIDYNAGLKIKSPGSIWILKRVGNKGGEAKYNIIVTIKVNEVAFNFLNMESGRNMVKLQQYFNGFFKGFLASDPDNDLLKDLSNYKYEVTSPEHARYQKGNTGDLVCRNPFFSPVSTSAYYEVINPSRVRIDILFKNKGQ